MMPAAQKTADWQGKAGGQPFRHIVESIQDVHVNSQQVSEFHYFNIAQNVQLVGISIGKSGEVEDQF